MSIIAKNVCQSYGDNKVVENVNFELETGTINILMGKSGTGKSTVLRMLGGVRPQGVRTPTSGEIFLGGQPCDAHHDEAVMVFQRYANRPDLTVWENVALPFRFSLWRKRFKEAEWKAKVAEMLKEVGLEDKAKLYPNQLSGGQNQRVALARALVVSPKYLLMDEPFGALDPIIRKSMQELLLSLLRRHPATVVMVTHDPLEATRLGDRILILGGKPATIVVNTRQTGKAVDIGLRHSDEALEAHIIANLT